MQLPHPDDTIAALASAAGGAARGIVRISGPQSLAVLTEWFQPNEPTEAGWPALRAARCLAGRVALSEVPRALPVDVYVWPGPRSYTGQPLVEIHAPGSPPLLERLMADLFARGVRPAQPGEFTLRAFLSGRIDLMQAEGVLGVIDARDGRELAQALEQLGGGLSSQIVRLRGDLLDLLSDLEAGLDFAEEDIEFVSHVATLGRIGLAREALADLLRLADERLPTTTRPRVVLIGPPNAGKSSLFNALLGSDTAIVSSERGTTRDYLTAEVTIGGVECLLIDTAGIEQAADAMAFVAQRMQREQQAQSDLVVWCDPHEESQTAPAAGPEGAMLHVRTKADLREPGEGPAPAAAGDTLSISVHAGTGLSALAAAIAGRLSRAEGGGADGGGPAMLGMTVARCRDSLEGAARALDRALEVARRKADHELLAIELREGLGELAKIVGAVYTDDILDRIFSRFCIGK